MTHEPADIPVRSPLGSLERSLVEEYLRGKGYDAARLAALDTNARDTLLKQASVYASAKLAEIEARSQYVHEIHEGGPNVAKSGLE